MTEEILLNILVLSIYLNITFAIISLMLIIVITIMIHKESHISADQ